MRTNIFTLTVAFSISFLACGNAETQSGNKNGNNILSGTIKGVDLENLYLLDLSQPNAGPVDTAVVSEDGSFTFNYQPKSIGFYRVNLNENMALVMPLKPSDKIVVKGNAMTPSEITVEGSDDAERMMEFNHYLSNATAIQQQLNQEFQQFSDHPQKDSVLEVFRDRYQKIETDVESFIRDLIDKDPALFSNLALMEQLRPDNSDNLPYFKKVDNALAPQYAASPFYQNFKRKVDEVSKFMPGSEVPEIELQNPDGEMVALSSLRGQVVLIDFWASWCKPCRVENPNVVAAYQKYKDKGFTVFGVSLDRTKEAWTQAIEKDKLTWTHVSDLKFWQSEAAKDYGVTGIPFAILIDEEGKVIGKNLRGQALHNKLAEVLD